MQANAASVLQEPSVYQNAMAPLDVHLVDTNDIFYRKGRNLAEKVYREIWNTEHLVDGNDYAVVISSKGNVIGNMNLQLKSREKMLKSEKFFGQEHWKDYFWDKSANIAEISALAISSDISSECSRLVMMSMIAGMQNLCRIESIQFMVTVQHEYLIRILTKNLHLPFRRNNTITMPQDNIPNDDYWNRKKLPGLYYLEPLSIAVVESCYSFLSYITLKGVPTAFWPRIQKADLNYSIFRKDWNQVRKEFCFS